MHPSIYEFVFMAYYKLLLNISCPTNPGGVFGLHNYQILHIFGWTTGLLEPQTSSELQDSLT